MGTSSPDFGYTITVDAAFVVAVTLYHLVLLLGFIMLMPRKVRALVPGAVDTEPDRAPEPPTAVGAAFRRAPMLYYAKREGKCFHSRKDCGALQCARIVGDLSPCEFCVSSCTVLPKSLRGRD